MPPPRPRRRDNPRAPHNEGKVAPLTNLNVLLLGLAAGFTIFLGLPVARLSRVNARWRGMLNSLSVGILLFLLIEVSEHAFEPVEARFLAASRGTGTAGEAALTALVFGAGILVGLLSLVAFEMQFIRRGAKPDEETKPSRLKASPMERVALMIAVGIGLHNFSEGLAIGAAAATGALSFAAVLGIGFALHNATEGFGIAAPLAGTKPSWRFLGVAGLIGGAPTFLGTLVGSVFESERISVLFLAVAAGALLYVIRELLHHGRGASSDPKDSMFVTGAIGVGLLLGFATEVALKVAGG